MGCAIPIALRTSAAIATGQSIPGAIVPVHALGLREPLDAALVLGRDHRPPVGEGESGAAGSRSRAITSMSSSPSRFEQLDRAGPAPRTRRRFRRSTPRFAATVVR